MLVLSHDHIIDLLSPPDVVAAVEAALRASEGGRASVPQRLHTDWAGNTLLTMPAIAEGHLGVKLVSVVPGNAARGLPVTTGLMVLNDAETGLPLALMNAAALTAVRTGAVGAVGLDYTTPADTVSVGVIGCGVQGAWQAIFACAVRPVREICCVARESASFDRFTTTVRRHAPSVAITRCSDPRDLLAHTSVVITATTSAEPVLPDDAALLEGKHFVAIGSYKPTMQELPDTVYRLAGHLVIDSELARHEVGDAIRPVEKGILQERDVFTLGQLVTGQRAIDVRRTTAYKSAGMALFDLFVARALFEAAKRQGIGSEITL
jgi:ornithine cyclodeaminase/alanine dehydrogenase-like protein (mu-crystallin family)